MAATVHCAEWLHRQYLDFAQGIDTLDDFADWLGFARRTIDRLLAGQGATPRQFAQVSQRLAEHYGYPIGDFLEQTGFGIMPSSVLQYRFERLRLHEQLEVAHKVMSMKAHTPPLDVPVWALSVEDYRRAWTATFGDSDRDSRNGEVEAEYAHMINAAIQADEELPESVLTQSLEFSHRAAQRRQRRARFEAQRGRAWGPRTDIPYVCSERGLICRRQDGQKLTVDQMDAIISGLDEVESVVGPLTDVLRSANVQIVHTNGKRPFFTSGAGGLYVSGQHTIVLGYERPALAHEIAHLLDHLSEHAVADRTLSWWSDWQMLEAGSLVRGGLRRFRRLRTLRARHGYWREPCEIWARLFEQFVSIRVSARRATPRSTFVDGFYFDQPGYWSAAAWAELDQLVSESLKLQMAAAHSAAGAISDHDAA